MAYTHYIGSFETRVFDAPNFHVSFFSPSANPVSHLAATYHEHMRNLYVLYPTPPLRQGARKGPVYLSHTRGHHQPVARGQEREK